MNRRSGSSAGQVDLFAPPEAQTQIVTETPTLQVGEGPKKRRGRPRKVSPGPPGEKSVAETTKQAADGMDYSDTQPKRRGRPRKHSVADADSSRDSRLGSLRERLSKVYGYPPDRVRPVHGEASCDAVVTSDEGVVVAVVELADKPPIDFEERLNELCSRQDHPTLAIWSNGTDYRFYARSLDSPWRRVVDFPENGRPATDVVRLHKKQLAIPETLIDEFGSIRAHIAGNTVGVTRDEAIVRDVVKILFCKIYDETAPGELAQFFAAPLEPKEAVADRIAALFGALATEASPGRLPDFLLSHSGFALDADAIAFAVSTLQHFNLSAARRDVVGEAFQALIGPSLRGEEGQFFTPKNVVEMAVRLVNPKPGERVIDPACGAAGFLVETAAHIARHPPVAEIATKLDAETLLVGIDKDQFLSSVAQAYFHLLGYSHARVFCADALKPPSAWRDEMFETVQPGTFDVVVTNPPFGARIPVKGEATLSQYRLASLWKREPGSKRLKEMAARVDARPPQILFVERCLQLLKPGGRMAIVLPDGILGNVNDSYVRQLVSELADIIAVVDCPLETFMPSTPTKTSVLVLRKRGNGARVPSVVFMAIAQRCGHDRRAKPLFRPDGTPDDDFPDIATAFEAWSGEHDAGF